MKSIVDEWERIDLSSENERIVGCSIIIPTVGRIDQLRSLLDKLSATQADDFEVILIFDRVQNPQVDVFGPNIPNLKIVSTGKRRGPAYCRNFGASLAKGNTLIFIDDDVSIQEGFIAYFRNTTVNSGSIYFPQNTTENDLDFPLSDSPTGGGYVSFCIWMLRSTFDAIGGFCEGFKVPYREDTEFLIRAKKLGIRLVTVDELFVFHPVRITSPRTFLRFSKKASYEVLFHKLTRGNYMGLLPTTGIFTSIPNRFGISIEFYFLLGLIGILVLGYWFGFLFYVLVIAAVFSIYTMLMVASLERLIKLMGRRPFLASFVKANSRIAYVVVTLPGRLYGSLRYRHFTV